MNVTVAKTAGFCFGVKRAVEKVYEQIQKTDKPIYTYGPIIHNEEVVKDLKKKGVEVIGSEEELDRVRDCVVVIRSHGVGKHIYDILEKNGVEIVDATCPYVKKIHRVVGGQVEALEFTALEGAPYLGIPLSRLHIEKGVLVAVLVRDKTVIIPFGSDHIEAGDTVILMAQTSKIMGLEDALK